MTDKAQPMRKISPFLLMIILVTIVLSLSALFIAVDSIINQSDILNSYSFLAIGFFGIAISAYMLLQTRGKSTRISSFEVPKVITTLECPKCDFKNIRDFEKGDYIFKENGSCQKCNENMKITAIYREVKKKKK